MALRLEDKKVVVAEVAEVAARAHSAIAAEYRGLTVTEVTELRKIARESNVYMRVVKNTLARRAVAGTDFECLQAGLTGPLMLAFSIDEPGAAARVIRDFSKNHKRLETKLVAIGGKLHDASALERVSKLPTREQALSMAMAVMKAPVEKLVRTIAEPHAKFVRTVDAIRSQKETA